MGRAGDAADEAAEAIRSLNHTTMSRRDITVTDVYEVLAALGELCQRLPQTFGQLADVLDGHLAAGHLGVDEMGRYRQASSAVSAARDALAAAAGAVGPVDTAVKEAHSAVARLKTVEPHLRAVPGEQPAHLRRGGPGRGAGPRPGPRPG